MTDAAIPLPPLLPKVTAALADRGIDDLRQLDGVSEKEMLDVPGLGPAQLGVLRNALVEHGLAFSDPVATPRATGRNDLTVFRENEVDPREWVETLPTERRVTEGRRLLELFGEATGEPARMWGPSIVGYGHYHYVYDTGREGDTCRVGFSPRKASISLYGLLGVPGGDALLERLGPHKTGKGCLYVTALARVDEEVLRDLISAAWAAEPTDDC